MAHDQLAPPADEDFRMILADGTILYSSSTHGGGSGLHGIWRAPILPVVDFDEDGSVGMSDLLILVEAWETDDPRCDIGPMPWGDGAADETDLNVLMGHWGRDVSIAPVELVAHWVFDEIEGMKAHDSTGTHDANLVGDPLWQPERGMIGGALELSGVGDYVSALYRVAYG